MTRIPNVHEAEPIPAAARAEIERMLVSGDLFRYTAPRDAPVTLLERDFAVEMGSRYALAVSSCSAALFLSLKGLGLSRGARVLVPGFTFAAVPSAVIHADCVPVLCEVGADYRIDLDDFAARLDGVEAVIVSHMRGHTSDMDAIMALCDARGLPVIEDAAHSLGTLWRGRRIGTIGRVGCFSFQSYKLVNAGEGGILVTDDADLVARAVILSGAYEHNWAKHMGAPDPALEAAFARWQNRLPLYNLRLSNLSAAIIRAQIPEIARRVRDGRANHDRVAARLDASPWLSVPAAGRRGARARFDPVQPRGPERRGGARLCRCGVGTGRQGADLRHERGQCARLLELEIPARAGPRSAADARDADARLRRAPARAADGRGVRRGGRGAGRGGRGRHGPGTRLRNLTGPGPPAADGPVLACGERAGITRACRPRWRSRARPRR